MRSWGEGDGIDWIEKGISICLGSCFCERGCAVEMISFRLVWRRYFGGVLSAWWMSIVSYFGITFSTLDLERMIHGNLTECSSASAYVRSQKSQGIFKPQSELDIPGS